MGKEAVFSASMTPQAKSFFSAQYIFELKDKDKWLKMFDKVADLMNGPALAGLFDSTGMKIGFTVQHAAATYQGVPIDSAKATITLKDPNSPQAQMMQKMYGNFEYRMAVVGQFGVMAIGGDADADVRKLIDQAKAGGPKQMGKEIKAAMDILPEAKTADFIATYNIVRAISMMPAMMPMPMPLPNIQTKSNLVFAASMDKGKGMLQVGLPKEHLTEMMQVFQMMMMQQMQQKQQQPGGPKPTPQVQ